MSLFFINGKALKSEKLQPIFFVKEGPDTCFSLAMSSAKLKDGKVHYLLLDDQDRPILSDTQATKFMFSDNGPYGLQGDVLKTVARYQKRGKNLSITWTVFSVMTFVLVLIILILVSLRFFRR